MATLDTSSTATRQDTMRRFRLTVPRAIALYGILVTLFLSGADYFYARANFPAVEPNPVGVTSLTNRLAWYRQHVSNYDLIFLGDSKTYCGIHPELLDPLLGSRSLNLSNFANWLPTQFPLAQDIAPIIPKGTTVVWSIGTVNFWPSTGVQRVYPIGMENAARFWIWGVNSTGFVDNVLYYNPALYFLSQRAAARQSFVDLLDRASALRTLAGIGTAEASPSQPADTPPTTDDQAIRAKREYEADRRVAQVDIVKDASKITSLAVYFHSGSYYRVELDPAFFRDKQQEITSRWQNPAIDPSLWRVFDETLRVFKSNGVNLIVNEMEEAPFIYGGTQERFRQFMRETVQKRVEDYGFRYVRVDFDRLTDEDYFDYNHLNSRGAKTYIPMLADQLRPYLKYHKLSSAPSAAVAR